MLGMQALASATGKTPQKVKAEYDKEGDLGKVAASARATQKTMFKAAPLTVQGVFK
jgi:DNA ligase-1